MERGAAFECEVVDSQTGEQIFAVVRCAKSGMFDGMGMTKLSDAKHAIAEWCDKAQENIRRWREGGGVESLD